LVPHIGEAVVMIAVMEMYFMPAAFGERARPPLARRIRWRLNRGGEWLVFGVGILLLS